MDDLHMLKYSIKHSTNLKNQISSADEMETESIKFSNRIEYLNGKLLSRHQPCLAPVPNFTFRNLTKVS